jgi:HK97 family phage portal protein
MGIISGMERRMALGPMDDSWYAPGGFFYGGGGGLQTKTGTQISETSALQLAIIWCCIKVLSEDSASLPLHLYRRISGGGRERATDNSLYALLHDQPNPEMTAMSFREAYMSHLLSWGNAYAEKVYGRGSVSRAFVEQLWPIPPNRVTPKRDQQNQITYHISMAGTGKPDVILSKEKVLHTPGLSFDGIKGYSPIAYHREAIGLGKALEEFGELYFGQGTHPGVIISHPGKLSPEGHQNLKASLAEAHSGLGKSHRLMLLQEAMKVEKIGIPNDEAQWLESRSYQNIDIGSRIYRLPPQMYGEYDKASTYASAEQFNIDYVVKTLRSWLVRLEQSFNMSLIPEQYRADLYFEHAIGGLLRGDSAARASFYRELFQVGGITPNQIAEMENWNPIGPEGDKRFVPLNMVPLDQAGRSEPEPPTGEQNRSKYQERLVSAYQRLLGGAIEKIIKQEEQRVGWLKKNGGDIDEFYRKFPEYIEKHANPVFFSFAEAIIGMESELNGLKYDDLKPEIEQFTRDFASNFASKFANGSREGDTLDELAEGLIEFLREKTGQK